MLELHCVCAVTDKPYVLRYRQSRDGKLQLAATEKLNGGMPPRKAAAGSSVSAAKAVPLSAIETLQFTCPWCGDISINRCDQCGGFVCGGRTTGNRFICRPSCGATWIGVPLDTLDMSERREARKAPMASPKPAVTALALTRGSGALMKR